jgi:hypothetical protein
MTHLPKRTLKITLVLLFAVELSCVIAASPGSRPNNREIRQKLNQWSQNPTPENTESLHAAIDRAEGSYRQIRAYALVGLCLNTVAMFFVYRALKAPEAGGEEMRP